MNDNNNIKNSLNNQPKR